MNQQNAITLTTSSGETDQFAHRYVVANGIRLHCVEAGTGPLVILLHGFPEFWWSWRHQIPALANAGFHVVAPDMRGYNLSDKPKGVKNYYVNKLISDVAALIRAFGEEKATIAGHDWGAGVAWSFTMGYPEMLDKLVILNGPHPAKMMAGLRSRRQLRKSWYMFFFQLPWVPEFRIRRRNFEMIRKTFRVDLKRDKLSDADLDRYVEAISQKGALESAINYYRAAFRAGLSGKLKKWPKIESPVMVIWGDRDRYLGNDLANPGTEFVSDLRLEWVPDSSHWVQVDAADRVNDLILQFIKKE
ncbi:MAG TPA: alpha/beta hydrolase [Blastocatellia bacterium]|nr:alpha/beta hydrolase [Blastocatellia bacterium]